MRVYLGRKTAKKQKKEESKRKKKFKKSNNGRIKIAQIKTRHET